MGFDVWRYWILRRQLAEDNIQLVYAVNWLASAYCLLASPSSARVVSNIRNSRLPSGSLKRFLLKRLLPRSTAIVVNSERGGQLVRQNCGVSNQHVSLVENGLDSTGFNSVRGHGMIRAELEIPDSAWIVAYVGRMARVKNIPRLLSVAARLFEAAPALHLVIAGDGLDATIVRGTPLESEVRLHCLGPRRDIPSLLADANVLLLTSDSEGTPNVVLEALASCLPVVAPPVGDLASVLPGDCGVLVTPEPERLASAVLYVLENQAAFRTALERYLPVLRSTYSVQTMAERTVNIWERALGL